MAIAAAHGALLEVGSLLKGRAPVSANESTYVEQRAAAIEALAGALREAPNAESRTMDAEDSALDTRLLIEARAELDQITGFNSVSQLEELTQEVRMLRGGHD